MPSGKVHDRITVVAAVAAAPAWWEMTPLPHDPTECGILVSAILFSGLMLSPDLDLNSSIYQRWGPLRFIWLPYQKLIPHRSLLSHSFFLGPLLRVLYFLLVVWALFRAVTWGVSFLIPMDRNALTIRYADVFVTFWQTHPRDLEMAALGLFVGTALHCLADILVTGYKRRF